MNDPDFDKYYVSCSRSEKYGERFAIGLVAKMQLEELKHVSTELELRTEMVKMGISNDVIEDTIRRAREHRARRRARRRIRYWPSPGRCRVRAREPPA